jgi:VIT1/CCC1 family predicted Fe2+/Mn2+ transporter
MVSVAAIVAGVAGATSATGPILTAGTAGLVGGAISMALGEYVAVSSQSDSERALIQRERRELADMPAEELDELTDLDVAQGLNPETARQVAVELPAHDALSAHLAVELHLAEDDVVSPWQAAAASAAALTVGAILPMLAILLPPGAWRIPVTFVAVLLALALTGAVSARIGGSTVGRATLRVVLAGALALAATYGVGLLLGSSGVA